MTREEREKAIDLLDNLIGMVEDNHKSDYDTALRMGIKALEQEPRKDEVILTKKEYGELVSSEFENGYAKGYREAMEEQEICEDAVSRKTIVEMLNARGQGSVMTFDHFIELLYKLPSVTPTQRWIPVSERLPKKNDGYLVTVKQGYVTTALWCGVSKYWVNVTAWQYLPEPYVPDTNVGKIEEMESEK